MVDRELVILKSGLVQKHINRIGEKTDTDLQSFLKNIDSQEIVSFNLHLAIENCIDIGSHIVSEEAFGIPGSSGEMFHLLFENGFLSLELSDKMSRAAGLRNLIVHEYDKLDAKRLFEIARKDVHDLENYLKSIFKKLGISA
jgi:uncharacterized protein YutE (UPF0331/DUF86 family)